ncbi:hypothetical protein LCGC14_1569130 [marine sediment metagenome]|uniref:Uncharacterized protein n=1 Tax=marine sediment metagenome TaxID=412755 RepID=A0A0F9IKA0_9ZZZZ|nr:tetratricopeptide repeat protein [Candidatus Aminicenantes bacterium]
MFKAIRNSYSNRNIAKILDAVIRAFVVITGVAIAGNTLGIFLRPQVAYAEENHPQKLVKQLKAGHQQKYDLKVREFLESQKEFGNPASAYQTLDHLFDKIKIKIRPRTKYNKEEAIKALKAIDGVLKKEGKFEYRKNKLLIEGLKKQKDGKRFIDCDDFSSIYLFAGERLGLFLEPVYAPRHVFLRCRLDDYTSFYWEPTLAAEKDVGFYKDWLNIPDESIYPIILNKNEFEAIHLNNLGAAWYEKGDYVTAVECYKKAIRLNPDYAEAINNLGVIYSKRGNLDIAMDCYKKATRINPNYAAAFSNIGVVFYKQGYLQKAIELFEKAIEKDSNFDKAHANRDFTIMERDSRK